MELGCGSFVEMEWPYFFFISFLGVNIKYSMPGRTRIGIFFFFCFTPRNSSSARLGQNSRASTSISSIAKMRSSSLIGLLAITVASRENR